MKRLLVTVGLLALFGGALGAGLAACGKKHATGSGPDGSGGIGAGPNQSSGPDGSGGLGDGPSASAGPSGSARAAPTKTSR
jgi:hypothetical protein